MEIPPRPGSGPLTPTEPIARVETSAADTTVVNVAPPEPTGDGRPPRMPKMMLALMAAVIALAIFWWFSQTQQAEEVSLNATVTAVNQATATADAAAVAAAAAQATTTAAQAQSQ